MDIQENENKPEILPIKDNLELDINENIIKEEKLEPKIIENINSPQLIQDILHLSSHSTQNDYQHQNNLIKSLYSFNDSIIPILDDDFIEDKINYNPKIKFLSMKKKLNSMNFEQINPQNNYLKKKIEQYHDLKKKISEYKTNINEEEKENNDIDNKNELIKKLFLINHPMINLFKDDIDVIKIKNEIEKQFQEKMKDNSNYKPGPLNPHLIHVVEEQEHESIQQELSVEDDEDDDNNEEMSEHSEESFIDIYEPNEGEQHENEGNNENNANNANNNNLVNQSENNNNNNNQVPVENNNINQNQPNNYIELPNLGEEIVLLNNINAIPIFDPINEENNNEVEHEIPEVLAPPINPEPGIIQELAGNLEENNEVENEPNNNIEGNNININELPQQEIPNGNNVLDNNQNMEENNENNNE